MAAMLRLLAIVLALLVGFGARDAVAQSKPKERRIALGATISTKVPSGDEPASISLRPSFWLGQTSQGWHWKYGLNWYSTELDWAVGNQSTDGGKLNIRPLMVGYGYSHVVGRTTVTAKVLGGYAFTSFSLHPSTVAAYRLNPGVTSVDTAASNTMVLKPEISAWIDLGHKLGLNMSTGYMVARPEVTARTSAGMDRRERIRADRLSIKIGVGYTVF